MAYASKVEDDEGIWEIIQKALTRLSYCLAIGDYELVRFLTGPNFCEFYPFKITQEKFDLLELKTYRRVVTEQTNPEMNEQILVRANWPGLNWPWLKLVNLYSTRRIFV